MEGIMTDISSMITRIEAFLYNQISTQTWNIQKWEMKGKEGGKLATVAGW